jgi:hypothetical protein
MSQDVSRVSRFLQRYYKFVINFVLNHHATSSLKILSTSHSNRNDHLSTYFDHQYRCLGINLFSEKQHEIVKKEDARNGGHQDIELISFGA